MTKKQIVNELKNIAESEGDFNLNAEKWYNRIKNSSGDNEMLGKIFNIPEYLVKNIKNCD